MRGLNRVTLTGHVQDKINYGATGDQSPACSFTVVSSRTGQGRQTVTAFVKVNVYGEGLVGVCRARLRKGVYILIEGELMNRDGVHGNLTEVRARELIFPANEEEAAPLGGNHGG